ncbi:DsbC family protein [Duganella callida]|uniref:Thiol:disulfide interchange protein n=1 Tax=Duganella callida TaxID=2561932 RepID=A0A4Y9S9S1_9BURK|nr:DsbC family protein [Duganella callida]TFW18640.1 DsbC family protein [Duganella callida]
MPFRTVLMRCLLAATLCLAGAAGASEPRPAADLDFASLPLQQAIKLVHGNGRRRLALFSDPDCRYCQRLERDTLSRLDDVTIYVFLFPLDQHDDAARKARLIWCAPDRAGAWDRWMRDGQLPQAGVCLPPLAANRKLGEALGVRATPTLVLPQGQLLPGAVDLATLEHRLRDGP